jgi:hypothetical protein
MSVAGTPVHRRAVADPVLPAAVVVAGFEIGMLLRCVRTGSGRYEHRATISTAVELSRGAAASRLVSLLTRLGLAARRDDFAAGGRHRYTVHRVVCPDLDDPLLSQAWCAGYRWLCDAEPYRTPRQRRHRSDLATAVWRSAVLAGGLRGRGGPLAVRVSDAELALILVRAARVLGAPVTLRTTGGRHLVEVTAGTGELALRELATTTLTGGNP